MEPGVTKLIPKYLHGISRNSTGVAWHSWAYGNSAPSYARLGDSSSSLELIVEDMNGSAVVPLAHGPPGRPQLHAGRSIEPRRPRNGEFDVHSARTGGIARNRMPLLEILTVVPCPAPSMALSFARR